VIRFIAATTIFAITFTAEYWFYGGLRGMIETIGFHPATAAFGFMLTASVVAWLLLPWVLIKFFWFADRGLNPWLVAVLVAAGIVLGGASSEIRILSDEARFLSEVAHTGGAKALFRDRTWPNEMCTLCYRPGQGVWGTD
jgi:hypothetical protein